MTSWQAYNDTGVAMTDLKQSFLDEETTIAQAKQMLTKYGGYTTEEAARKVAELGVEKLEVSRPRKDSLY